MRFKIPILTVLLCLLSACGAPSQQWTTEVERDHPLVGRIVDPATSREVASTAAARRLRDARFLLLGEKHDNPDHHLIQAQLLMTVTDSGRRPAVAWEMIDEDLAPKLAAFLGAERPDAAELGAALGWAQSGWPDWRNYQPIAEAAIGARLPMAAANLPRGFGRRAAAPLASPLPASLLDGLKDELASSHCGQLPPQALTAMAQTQQRRDLAMADSLLAHATADGAVLIAGNGHVRRDRGVPWWLVRLGVDPTAILSIGVLEVDPGRVAPTDLSPYAAQFDLIYLTPRVDSEDACAKFADQLKRLRNKS